jgi:hypothetical protein
MQIVLETDEAWSLMSVITSYVIDHSGVSQDGKQKVRAWRTARAVGTVEMDELAEATNAAMGTHIGEKTARVVRRKGRYMPKKEAAR